MLYLAEAAMRTKTLHVQEAEAVRQVHLQNVWAKAHEHSVTLCLQAP